MRTLLLFRGSPAVGKSTFIKQNGLEQHTLSADNIRLLCQSPKLNTDGTYSIGNDSEKKTWDILFELLEQRMSLGEFTVIDATNSKTVEMNKYKVLAEKYKYRIYIIDMTDVPIETVKQRNRNREELKRVPEQVIDKMYARFKSQQIPSGIKVLKPEQLSDIYYCKHDMNDYKNIFIFGDIHGCSTCLKDSIDKLGGLKDESCYIFVGDYLDRGIENKETLEFLLSIYENKNVLLLEGNHEIHLWNYANDKENYSKEFRFKTRPQIQGIDKKEIRKFYRKLIQCTYFEYDNKEFLITHGGLSTLPENLLYISTNQMIKGVGNYNEGQEVDEKFCATTKDNQYQIHGHRNIFEVDVQNTDRTFNLEGGVEFGGCLRVVQINKDGIFTHEFENKVFEISEKFDKIENLTDEQIVSRLSNNKFINVKNFNHISSFNFNRQAFNKGIWDSFTTKARGLYINTEDNKIVARGYNKFFNANEVDETKEKSLYKNLEYPVNVYIKENGFLGILGYDYKEDKLIFATKSVIGGEYAQWFENLFRQNKTEYEINCIKEYLKNNNCTMVFEVIDKDNDPHIIEYKENKIVLLDIIKNNFEFEKICWEELNRIGNWFNLETKKIYTIINNWNEYQEFLNNIKGLDFKIDGEFIEGFVLEDSNNFMWKIKLDYYNIWKGLRGMVGTVLKTGYYPYTGSLILPIQNEFYGYLKYLFNNLNKEDVDKINKSDIIKLRNEFNEWKKKIE